MSKEIVPVVIYHKDRNYDRNGVYEYQVFMATYDRGHHTIRDISKEYECFDTEREVTAYIKGLEASGILYGKK